MRSGANFSLCLVCFFPGTWLLGTPPTLPLCLGSARECSCEGFSAAEFRFTGCKSCALPGCPVTFALGCVCGEEITSGFQFTKQNGSHLRLLPCAFTGRGKTLSISGAQVAMMPSVNVYRRRDSFYLGVKLPCGVVMMRFRSQKRCLLGCGSRPCSLNKRRSIRMGSG